ncbi:hypothetical protein [Paraburkholderia kururiensis]|uniref:hypothetical protein n=1 Tax=Paraburkholderia kururiensis TaxID=984307 RepID=UPI0018F31CFC|nr:hypothetical protein [Paraburkholderia kururiensis]
MTTQTIRFFPRGAVHEMHRVPVTRIVAASRREAVSRLHNRRPTPRALATTNLIDTRGCTERSRAFRPYDSSAT